MVNTKDYTVTRDLAVKTFPSNLSLDESGQVLFASVSEPSSDTHPDYAAGTMGSVIRLDLTILGALPQTKAP
ncbi:hypothetical protein [Pseudogemmobacter bohemicus]|uniref:hypothetical protein n=1 Tax=Pseudogemmobacter bohemicus TaxID=2250708 RepID=UPI000DD40FED|nr:hypothetical protein [Pseudogemmobacter bohemicus]